MVSLKGRDRDMRTIPALALPHSPSPNSTSLSQPSAQLRLPCTPKANKGPEGSSLADELVSGNVEYEQDGGLSSLNQASGQDGGSIRRDSENAELSQTVQEQIRKSTFFFRFREVTPSRVGRTQRLHSRGSRDSPGWQTVSNKQLLPIFTIYTQPGNNITNQEYKVENIHKAFQPCLYVAFIIGIMPIYGITDDNTRNLQFRWKSWRSVTSLIGVFGGLFLVILAIALQGINPGSIGLIMFYLVSTTSMILFLLLARGWKEIIRDWNQVSDFLGMGGNKTIRELKRITIIMIVLSICEHILANLNGYFKNVASTDQLKNFFVSRFPLLFRVTEYTVWKGFIFSIIHFQLTIVWNFTDIFLINIATALSNIFQFYNDELVASGEWERPLGYWKEKREMYCKLAGLVKTIDKKVSNLVLLSFGSNLFFICMQLYFSLNNGRKNSIIRNIYFFVSFGYLLLRTSYVCLSAANMYECSKKPLSILFSTSSQQFNIEIQRLMDSIIGETLALTGYNFFTLNRTLILTVAGTVATYEIVLVQFKSFND